MIPVGVGVGVGVGGGVWVGVGVAVGVSAGVWVGVGVCVGAGVGGVDVGVRRSRLLFRSPPTQVVTDVTVVGEVFFRMFSMFFYRLFHGCLDEF